MRSNTEKNSQLFPDLLRFEQLLSEMSAKYINLPVDKIEASIVQDLGRLVRFLGADRGVLYLADGRDGSRKMYFPPPLAWPVRSDDRIRRRIETAVNDDPSPDRLQFLFDKWFKRKIVQFIRTDELPKEASKVKDFYDTVGVRSLLSVPLFAAGTVLGALVVTTVRTTRNWPAELIPRIRLFAEAFGNALLRKQSEEKLQRALSEITVLKERIEADYAYLREEINRSHDSVSIIGKSRAIKDIIRKVDQVATTDVAVLLLGETGTGKGLIARAVHEASIRKHRPFMQVNCAALAPGLIESELFGHERGAFTGAQMRRLGRFERANGSTLFLDEIGEVPLELQPKLLRVLEDGEFERVGGNESIKVDVRIIAATNRDLEKEVKQGKFRKDLWYRLATFPILVPPLRERPEDISLYLAFFLDKYSNKMGKNFDRISQRTVDALRLYSWPGNVREIENLVERAVITGSHGVLKLEIPKLQCEGPAHPSEDLRKIERDHITKVLEAVHWRINGPKGAAVRLNLNPSTLRGRIRKLGIRRSSRRDD